MPPPSLAAANAVSMPSLSWRPISLAGPENGAAMPKRISVSVTPCAVLCTLRVAVGAALAIRAARFAGLSSGRTVGAVGAGAAAAGAIGANDGAGTGGDEDVIADDGVGAAGGMSAAACSTRAPAATTVGR